MKRIGVAFPGDPSQRATWSGTPSGVMRGLAEAGAEAVAIDVEPSRLVRTAAHAVCSAAYLRPNRDVGAAVRQAKSGAMASPALGAVHTWTAPSRIRRAGRLDGIVQIGTGYTLATAIPVATFEDMTVLQTRSHPYAGWDALSEKAFGSRVERQRAAYERAVACCLTSRWAAESVIRDYGIAPEKVHVVGVGRNHTAPEADRDWSEPRFLFVGLDWERKNGAGLLRAFARLREQLPGARLDVVGGHPPIEQPGVVAHGVLRLDVPEQHQRLERLFAEATCFVMPSHSEAVGIAYVEAADAGLPSIGTSSGGSDYLIGDGGLIVDPSDDEALLSAMRELADPVTAERMGAAAKRRSEMFTWAEVGRRVLKALEGVPAAPLAALA